MVQKIQTTPISISEVQQIIEFGDFKSIVLGDELLLADAAKNFCALIPATKQYQRILRFYRTYHKYPNIPGIFEMVAFDLQLIPEGMQQNISYDFEKGELKNLDGTDSNWILTQTSSFFFNGHTFHTLSDGYFGVFAHDKETNEYFLHVSIDAMGESCFFERVLDILKVQQ